MGPEEQKSVEFPNFRKFVYFINIDSLNIDLGQEEGKRFLLDGETGKGILGKEKNKAIEES